jgi:hypothetical protein
LIASATARCAATLDEKSHVFRIPSHVARHSLFPTKDSFTDKVKVAPMGVSAGAEPARPEPVEWVECVERSIVCEKKCDLLTDL